MKQARQENGLAPVRRVLFAWELGEGLGHLAGCAPLLRELQSRGHHITAVVKHVPAVGPLVSGAACRTLPLPAAASPAPRPFARPMTFAHVLYNSGFHDPVLLADRLAAWRAVFTAEHPDVILCEHSPAALVAARGFPAARVVIGTGFTCPPDLTPLPCLRHWLTHDPRELARDEGAVLATVNGALRVHSLPALLTLACLYGDADATILRSFPELDPYPMRRGVRYWGAWLGIAGDDPGWQTGCRPRIFAYLKPMSGIGDVLAAVAQVGGEVVAYVPGLPAADQTAARAAGVRLLERPANIQAAAQGCDVAILNGTHGTTAAVLLAGKPIVQLPIYLEQVLTALRTVTLGAGRIAARADPGAVLEAVREVHSNPNYRAAAERFARRYRQFEPQAAVRSLADWLEARG